ncbi:hypothetical protein PIB30_032391 [Stylosanthes scabra]|uniref:Uncharacterized protein n=1 Tax=Stylosanthes scabra TaxID=79078 RepID=A0ABU6WE98_9FABA|nr:hypothetical protein [Stylosanthes scabra]
MPDIWIQDGMMPKIAEYEAVGLEEIPNDREIKEAVWSCNSTKASGPEGYNMAFIKKVWDTIGREFTTLVKAAYGAARG